MREKIYSFYTNKFVFLLFAICSLLLWIGWAVSILVTDNPIKLFVFAVIFFIITLGLVISYITGSINLQKMFFGSLLLFLVVDYVELVDLFISLQQTPFIIVTSITLALLIIFFVCHMLQQLDHVGKFIIVIINQCCGLAIILEAIFIAICVSKGTATATDFTFCLAVIFTLFLVICMEIRISRYKQIRLEHKTKGDWNEETRTEAKKLFKIF